MLLLLTPLGWWEFCCRKKRSGVLQRAGICRHVQRTQSLLGCQGHEQQAQHEQTLLLLHLHFALIVVPPHPPPPDSFPTGRRSCQTSKDRARSGGLSGVPPPASALGSPRCGPQRLRPRKCCFGSGAQLCIDKSVATTRACPGPDTTGPAPPVVGSGGCLPPPHRP